jgi:hypothetical protein
LPIKPKGLQRRQPGQVARSAISEPVTQSPFRAYAVMDIDHSEVLEKQGNCAIKRLERTRFVQQAS